MNKVAAKQQRIDYILSTLKKFDYMTRAQLQRIHSLKSERNANRILNDMGEYLHSFRNGQEKIYYLSKAGRDRIGAEVVRKKTPNVEHYLLRNQLWMHLGFSHTWENEMQLTVKDISVVCDAQFRMKDKNMAYVEVDISQPMTKNRAKIEKYRKMKELTGNPFHLVWVTATESRRAKLKELMQGLPGHVFTLNDIK